MSCELRRKVRKWGAITDPRDMYTISLHFSYQRLAIVYTALRFLILVSSPDGRRLATGPANADQAEQ